jgi:hypothetical protein
MGGWVAGETWVVAVRVAEQLAKIRQKKRILTVAFYGAEWRRHEPRSER